MAGRPVTGRQQGATANREINYSGVGLNTKVNVEHRPVTQQGMMGMRIKTAGPGRQVQDASYFITLLRTKCSELTSEITKFKGEINQHESDSSSYVQLERRYEELIKEVRMLEGQLADYNLAMDKSNHHTPVEDVQAYLRTLEDRNQSEKRAVDQIFLERQGKERQCAEIEQELQAMDVRNQQKIGMLAPKQRAEYMELQQHNQRLQQMVGQRRGEFEALSAQVRQHEGALQQDHFRDEFAALAKRLKRLTEERESLNQEIEATQLDPAEARDRLMTKVKEDNAKIVSSKREAEEAEAQIGQRRRQLSELAQEVNERKGDNGDSEKYNVLFQRDQEMSKFIETFETAKAKELNDQGSAKEMIVGLLEHTSKSLDRGQNLPTSRKLGEMRDDLSFKEKQMDASSSTQDRLQAELKKRHAELDKINTLDSKISVELTSLKAKINTMQDEMVEFEDIDKLRATSDDSRHQLQHLTQSYTKRRDAVKMHLKSLQTRYDKKKNQLVENETAKVLQNLEQKLRHHEQNIFHLQEFIELKSRETDFQSQKEDCGRIIDDLNALHIAAASDVAYR